MFQTPSIRPKCTRHGIFLANNCLMHSNVLQMAKASFK